MADRPFAARTLYRSFKTADLDDISVEVVPLPVDDLGVFSETFLLDRVVREAEEAGLITNDQSRGFHADLEQAAETGGFFASVQLVLVSGRRPDVTTGV